MEPLYAWDITNAFYRKNLCCGLRKFQPFLLPSYLWKRWLSPEKALVSFTGRSLRNMSCLITMKSPAKQAHKIWLIFITGFFRNIRFQTLQVPLYILTGVTVVIITLKAEARLSVDSRVQNLLYGSQQ